MARFDFENDKGVRLAGQLELPDGDPRAFAIFAHCFTCSKNVHAATRISRQLASLGFATLRFDFTGLGNSDGDFANSNFSSNVADLIAAANALRAVHSAPCLLVGHSLGGAAVLMAAGKISEVRAVATIGAPSEPAHVQHLFADSIPDIQREGHAEVNLAGRMFRIESHFLEDLQHNRLLPTLKDLDKALLICHSPIDSTVSIENARHIYEAARHPKSFLSLDGSDHLLTDSDDAQYLASILAIWASRYTS